MKKNKTGSEDEEKVRGTWMCQRGINIPVQNLTLGTDSDPASKVRGNVETAPPPHTHTRLHHHRPTTVCFLCFLCGHS